MQFMRLAIESSMTKGGGSFLKQGVHVVALAKLKD